MNIKLLQRIGIIRVKKLAGKQFIYIISIVIGIIAGLVASLIKTGVHQLQALLRFAKDFQYQSYLHILYPLIGIGLAVIFIKFIIKRHVGHGVPSVLYAISKQYGIIPKHNTFSSIVSSILTVGFGGSVGLEGPTVATGAAFGSSLGQIFRLNYRQITQLLAIASAAALAAIFKAPIAAIVFAVEVIMVDLTVFSLVPLLLSSGTAVLVSYFFLGQDVLYPFKVEQALEMTDLPYYILLGIIAGFVSVYFIRMYIYIGELFDKLGKGITRLLVGGIGLGILIFLFPSLFGEGYEAINACLAGDMEYLFNNSFQSSHNYKRKSSLIHNLCNTVFYIVKFQVRILSQFLSQE